MADPEDLASQLGEPATERHVETLEHDFAKLDFAVTVRHEHCSERARIFRGIETEYLEAPRPHGATRRFCVPIMTFEDVLESFFLHQHLERLPQAIEQVRCGRVRKKSALVRPEHL